MIRLALTLAASPQESPTSYLSRLAARNFGDDLGSFCLDTGIDLAALSTGDMGVVRQINSLAGLPDQQFAQTTIVKTSTMKYRVGTEALNTETLSRGEIRYCRACLAADLTDNHPHWQAIHQLHWQMIQIRHCWCHGRRLETCRPQGHRFACLDVTTLIGKLGQTLLEDRAPADGTADALDHYLTHRIYGRHGENWCNRLEIPALIKACEAFGVLLDHGRDARASALGAGQRRDAMLTGFNVLSAGEAGIRAALDGFNRATPTRGGNQPHPRNGEVQRLLGSHCKMRQDLDPLRDIVRAYFLDNYPFQPGTTVLGRKVTEARVLSIRAACRAIGMRRSLLEEILIRRGHASRGDDGWLQLNTALTVALIADIRTEKSDYLDQKQTADHLGCSFGMFKQLQRSGVLTPAEGAQRWRRKGFLRGELDLFLDAVGGDAKRLQRRPPGTCSLALATRKANCSVPDLIRLMLDGKLSAVGRLSDRIELPHLLIHTNELFAALPQPPVNGYTLTEACKLLFLDMVTLGVLIDRGFLTVKRMKSSRSRVTNDLITVDFLPGFGPNTAL